MIKILSHNCFELYFSVFIISIVYRRHINHIRTHRKATFGLLNIKYIAKVAKP